MGKIFWFIVLAIATPSLGNGVKSPSTKIRNPLDPGEIASPRDTLKTFLESAERIHKILNDPKLTEKDRDSTKVLIGRVFNTMDLSKLPETLRDKLAKESAVYLKEILDRVSLPPMEKIPDLESLAKLEDPLEVYRIPKTTLIIELGKTGPYKGLYKFSSETVLRAKETYQQVAHLPRLDHSTKNLLEMYLSVPGKQTSPSWLTSLPYPLNERFGDQALWQWLGFGLSLVIGFIGIYLCFYGSRRASKAYSKTNLWLYVSSVLLLVLACTIPVMYSAFCINTLKLTGSTMAATLIGSDVVFLVALMGLVIGVGDRVAKLIIATPSIKPGSVDAQFVKLMTKVLTIAVCIVLLLEGGQKLGIHLTTLLAGAGVGGLAIALAAQDTLKDLFGSIMILFDKPYRIGERIKCFGYDGFVEEIGLRSTKIRLLGGSLAILPNERVAHADIENVSRRNYFQKNISLKVDQGISFEDLKKILSITKEVFANHEGMLPDKPPRVFLNEIEFGQNNILILMWYSPADIWAFFETVEDLNLRLMKGLSQAGLSLATPTTKNILELTEKESSDLDYQVVQAKKTRSKTEGKLVDSALS